MSHFMLNTSPRTLILPGLILAGMTAAFAQGNAPALRFSGYADADFATSFAGGGLNDPNHLTGLEIDLTTTVTFSPRLNAQIHTTMTDGVVPAQGAGNTWAPVYFDGVVLNWQYDDAITLHVGDILYGTGYFNYYLHKRSAVVVGEKTLRGVGFTRDGLSVYTGASNLGVPAAPDTANPEAAAFEPATWSTFVKYDLDLGNGRVLAPSVAYTAGVPGATPFTGGLSFTGDFGAVSLSAHSAVSYYNETTDPGLTLLIEPVYTNGPYSLAATLFAARRGTAPNFPAQTLTGADFDDLIVYVEPGYALSEQFAVGLPLEYHDASGAMATAQGYDQSAWAVPTLYIYPGSGVQWWIWAQIIQPLSGAGSQDPQYFAGSEIIFRF